MKRMFSNKTQNPNLKSGHVFGLITSRPSVWWRKSTLTEDKQWIKRGHLLCLKPTGGQYVASLRKPWKLSREKEWKEIRGFLCLDRPVSSSLIVWGGRNPIPQECQRKEMGGNNYRLYPKWCLGEGRRFDIQHRWGQWLERVEPLHVDSLLSKQKGAWGGGAGGEM